MIRKLLATTAIATLISTGAYAQSTTAPAEDSAQATEEVKPDASQAAPADGAATGEAADETAQDTETEPAADTAQDTEMEPADDTAQTTTTTGSDQQTAGSELPDVEGHLASNLIGSAVYNGTSDDAENIGEVNDVVIGNDGKAQFVVIGVGGFLGIGEKDVAVEYATLEWAERDGDMWLVVETTKEQLEQQQAFDRTAYDPEAMAAQEQQAASDTATTEPAGSTTTQTDTAATAPATTGEAMESEETVVTTEPADEQQETAATTEPAESEQQDAAATDEAAEEETVVVTEAPADAEATQETAEAPAEGEQATDQTQTAAIDRSTLQETDMSAIRAEDFVGTTVYGANEETIGEIGDVILTGDGQIDAVLVDVGGFLGMGEKEVAIGMDNLQFMEDGDGNRYLYTQFTQEQLEAQPAYDEATYAENRDTMRLTVEN